MNIVQECDAVFCRNSCLGLPGPNSIRGSGGSGDVVIAAGSGGAPGSGSGGRAGSGGAPSATGSGGAPGGAGGAGTSGGGAGGGATVTYIKCRACEQAMCPEALAGCEQLAGNAEAGPKMGTARKDLCKAVVVCARAKKCTVEGEATGCYCGTADVDGSCMSGGANGLCKAEIEAAAESTDFKDIGPRFVNADPTMKLPYAIAAATDLLGCDGFFCADAACVTGDPPSATGGAPGSAGASGTGGRVGTGGAAGSGGAAGGGGATRTGGAPGSGGAAGSGGASGSGGTAGTGGTPTGNNALLNGNFDAGATSWTVGFGATATWTGTRDAAGSATSGSLAITNSSVVEADGNTMNGVRQCVRVNGSGAYLLAGQAFIPTGQAVGSAGVNISFYPGADCSGTVNGGYTSPLVTATNVWTSFAGSTTTPAAAQSALVQLVVLKTFRAAAVQAYFDTVSFRLP